MRKTLFLAAVLGITFLGSFGCAREKNSPLLEWNLYNGVYAAYNVNIDESQYKGEFKFRMIHLVPQGGLFSDKNLPNPQAITGHDLDGDGQFDRVFICSAGGGFNSVLFTGNGDRVWEPCLADKNKVQPFTEQQVISAQAMLYAAMSEVYNTAHRTSTLESWRAKYGS
jgi:hypothetical protein